MSPRQRASVACRYSSVRLWIESASFRFAAETQWHGEREQQLHELLVVQAQTRQQPRERVLVLRKRRPGRVERRVLERPLGARRVRQRRSEARELRRVEQRVEEARLSVDGIVRNLRPEPAQLLDRKSAELLLVREQPRDPEHRRLPQPDADAARAQPAERPIELGDRPGHAARKAIEAVEAVEMLGLQSLDHLGVVLQALRALATRADRRRLRTADELRGQELAELLSRRSGRVEKVRHEHDREPERLDRAVLVDLEIAVQL